MIRIPRALLSLFCAIFFVLCSSAFALEKIEGTANPQAVDEKERSSDEEVISAVVVPDDFQVQVFAREPFVMDPTAIDIDEQGRVFITETHRFDRGVPDNRRNLHWVADDLRNETVEDRMAMYEKHAAVTPIADFKKYAEKVRVIEDTDADGRADKYSVFADGFNDPLDGTAAGIMAFEGNVYFACIPHVWLLKDTDGDDVADERQSLQGGFGVNVSLSGHDLNGFAFGPDGRIYFTVGDRGYNFTTKEGVSYKAPHSGAIFRMEVDGSNVELVHRGLRNPKEISFDQYGAAFSVDNNADMGDKARVVYMVEGATSGWTRGNQNLKNFRQFIDVEDRHSPPWMLESQWDRTGPFRPRFYLPPSGHVSNGPSGLAYNPGVGLPERYDNQFFICDYRGARSSLIAFEMVPDGGGFQLASNETFSTGILNTDVAFGYDGKMYVSDYVGSWPTHGFGNILTIQHDSASSDPAIAEGAELMKNSFASLQTEKLASLLSHPDQRVRLRAQFELAKSVENRSHFIAALSSTNGLIHRLHGVWGLGQLVRKQEDSESLRVLLDLTKDTHARLRGQVFQVLGEAQKTAELAPAVLAKLNDGLSDPYKNNQMLAAIALGKQAGPGQASKFIELLRANAGSDPHVEHGAVYGLVRLMENKPNLLAAYEPDESDAVRYGIVLAYRHLGSDRLANFLDDRELSIAVEAAQGINDQLIESAIPALANARQLLGRANLLTDYRIINAMLRDGSGQSLKQLLAVAGDGDLREETRIEALFALGRFAEPSEADPTTGLIRPLATDGRSEILAESADLLAETLDQIVAASAGALQAKAVDTAMNLEVSLPAVTLEKLAKGSELSPAVRSASMEALAAQVGKESAPLMRELAADGHVSVRQTAYELYASLEPAAAADLLLTVLDKKSTRDQQAAYAVLAGLPSPAVAARLQADVEKLRELPSAIQLDALQAARARSESEVKAAVAAYDGSLPPGDLMAPFHLVAEGGDVDRGRDIFYNSGAAQCSRCHMGERGKPGGKAGPHLWNVAKRGDTAYLIESLVAPSAKLAAGYATVSMTLKDGSTVAGTLMKESPKEVSIKDLSSGAVTSYPRSEIESMPPGMSTMPPMGLILPKEDIRDLVAFMQTLLPAKKKK